MGEGDENTGRGAVARSLSWRFVYRSAILAALVVMTGWFVWGRGDGAVADAMPDFATLSLRDQPNEYLMLPSGFVSIAIVHSRSPVFDIPPPALEDVALRIIRSQPRVREIAADTERRQYAFIQRTAWLRFPDTITVRIVEINGARSSLAIYSRSKFGHSDFGANRRRIEAWLAAIRAALTSSPSEAG